MCRQIRSSVPDRQKSRALRAWASLGSPPRTGLEIVPWIDSEINREVCALALRPREARAES
jgi:hypothetical protein